MSDPNLVVNINPPELDITLDLNSYPIYLPAQTFVYNQTDASTVWTVNHNLGFYPAVVVLNDGGQELICQKSFTSVNQVIINLSIALTGKVICV